MVADADIQVDHLNDKGNSIFFTRRVRLQFVFVCFKWLSLVHLFFYTCLSGSPLEEIAPIKTSSPIELLAVEHIADDAEKPETSPLLFGIEDEEPVDLSKNLMNQRSESPKDIPYK